MTRIKDMLNAKLHVGVAGILIAVAGVAIYAVGNTAVSGRQRDSVEQRADIIMIDTLKHFGEIERQPVIFLHDRHTNTLLKRNKNCKACHLEAKTPPSLAEKKALSSKFKRLEDKSRKQVLDIYHGECIGCHKESIKAGKEAGPVEQCGRCHVQPEEDTIVSNWKAMGMSKSLHYRHTEATKDKTKDEAKCGLCHHQYDEEKKKLYYAKDKEGSCRYCHKEETEKNRMSIRLASHLSCVDCHRQRRIEDPTLIEKEKIGPITCAGCHDPQAQQKIKVVEDVPRIKRKQPDFSLIRAVNKELPKDEKEAMVLMDPVPFDHKAHETYNPACRTCHHASLDSCSQKCHTLEGKKEGDFIKLAQAMHQKGSEQSCLGCHDNQQKKRECAGCHGFIERTKKPDPSACSTCHMKPKETMMEKAEPSEIAQELLKERSFVKGTYEDDDIPEKIVIKTLSDQYEPAEFPHRKVVKALVKKTKDSKLAQYFHREKGTMCQGCHHGSPPVKKPPRCSRCHGRPFDENTLLRPGLKGAYHMQCLGCHKEMNIEKPKPRDCKVCHKEKAKK